MFTEIHKNFRAELIVLGIFLLLWGLHILIKRFASNSASLSSTDDDDANAAAQQSPRRVEVLYDGDAAGGQRNRVKLVFDTYIVGGKDDGGEGCGGGGGGGGECSICLDNYKENDKRATISACGHRFHAGCVLQWVMEHDTCPLCRSVV